MLKKVRKIVCGLMVVSLFVTGCGVYRQSVAAAGIKGMTADVLPVAPIAGPISKNNEEVTALKAIIAEKKALGATISEDLDSDEYTWSEKGNLIRIQWDKKNVQGDLSLREFPRLSTLYCYENQITGLDIIKNTELAELVCSSNQITSLNVSNNFKLKRLYCFGNLLTDLNIRNNFELTHLDCGSNQLRSLDVSKNFVLRELDCPTNLLTNLDVSKNNDLIRLVFGGNQITSLDVSHNRVLTNLGCNANKLTSLDIRENTELTSMDCGDNQITDLDVSNNTALTFLGCYKNQLTNLDVSHNTALVELQCLNNQITSLDLSNNTVLLDLSCGYNQITSLNVRNNIFLADLKCNDNKITSLDVSHNTALTELWCFNNQLTHLDVSNCTSLTLLYCDEDVSVTGRNLSGASPKPTASPITTATPEQPSSPAPIESPSPVPGETDNPGFAPEESPLPGASPSAEPPQDTTLLKVKKIKVQQTAGLNAKIVWEKIAADKIAVLRAEKKDGPYHIINQFSGDKTSYTDKTVKRGKTYYYKVVAHNGDLQAQLSREDLTVKKITVSYLIPPVISVKKGNSGGQKYVQIFLQKYEGKYADIYMKSNGRFQKLATKKRTIRAYRKKYRFRYRRGGVTLYFRVRTYQTVRGRKQISPYSKTVKIEI